MDDVWNSLLTVKININTDASSPETDRVAVKKINQSCVDGAWEPFYEGIDALERGCGYPDHRDLTEMCKIAGWQNSGQLLQTIEQKTKLLDVVLFLRSVEPTIKLTWIDNNSFSKTPVLFECLRQALMDTTQSRSYPDVIVKGLCDLSQMSSVHFQYLLNHIILVENDMIPIASKLLENLPRNGWATLSQCISFDKFTLARQKFWKQCIDKLAWDMIYNRAEPLLDAWDAYIKQSFSGHYHHSRQSLYCGVSNMLIILLTYKLNTVEQYIDATERTLCAGEKTMYCWYEHENQQFGALMACLSVIAHLHCVWVKNFAANYKLFPENIRSKCLAFLAQWRYLWVLCGKDMAGKEILQLENWFKCVPTV